MATPGAGAPSAEQIRSGQEAMGRNPAAAAGGVVEAVIGDLRGVAVQNGLEKAALQDPSFQGINSLVENNIGHRDDQGNIQRTALENNLQNSATNTVTLLKQYIENGYNNMGPLQNRIVMVVSDAILKSPQMYDRLINLTPRQRTVEADRMAREYLQDPNYTNKIVELLLQRADLIHPIEDKLTQEDIKLLELVAEGTRLHNEQITTDQTETDARNKLRLYSEDPNPPNVGNPNNGRFYNELLQEQNNANVAKINIQTLENQTIPNLDRDVARFQKEEARVDQFTMAYNTNPALDANGAVIPLNQYLNSQGLRPLLAIQGDITNAETLLINARTSLNTAKNNQSNAETKINQLKEEKTRAEESLKAAQAKKKEIDDKVIKIDKDVTTQQAKVNKLQSEKEMQESEWVRQLENIIKDATTDRLSHEAPLAAQKIKERMEERAKTEKDDNKRYLWSFESQQYIGPDGRPIRANIDADRAVLMNAIASFPFTTSEGVQPPLLLNGAEQALMNVMIRSGIMNADQIYGLLKDPTTRTEMSNTLAKDILTTHLWSGGRLSRGEIISIHRSEWGKGMVAQAFAGRADLQAQVDGMIGKGVMNWNEDILAQLGKIDWAKFAMILLIIAGVVGGGSLALGAFKG